jgi:hypothetical protein
MRYSRPSDFESMVLKDHFEVVEVDTSEACRVAAISMTRQAARSVDILSHSLDPAMYDNAEFCDALSNMVTGSRRARVRVLLRDTEPVIKHGHQLVSLAQRLSSFMELRVPAREFDEYNAAFLLVDEAGVIYRTLSDRFEATINFNDGRTAQNLLRQFEEMWQTATLDQNLRRSYL